MLNTWLALNPGLTRCKRSMVLIISPAPTSSTMARATSATASECRASRPEVLVVLRSPSLSTTFRSGREAWIAGAKPNRMAVSNETPSVNSRTRPSTPTSAAFGKSPASATSILIPA